MLWPEQLRTVLSVVIVECHSVIRVPRKLGGPFNLM
jgi:hypothetical protein